MKRHFLLWVALVLAAQMSWGTISNNTPTTPSVLGSTYYQSADNKKESALFSALTSISGGVTYSYTKLTYDELYTAYITSDVYPAEHANAGKIWDMYSTTLFVAGSKECGSYSKEGDCYNREHSMPKSWFGGSDNYKSTNQGCDLGHLVPTDGYVNGRRSNYAFGEVKTPTYTSNGNLSKLGSSVTSLNVDASTISGTSVSVSNKTVFEPTDDYKGDFARIYMYMRVRYASLNLAQADGGTVHFTNTTNAANDSKYGLKDYSVILLMKWHRQDPVSKKEIDRNNAMERLQGNRNPFIDYPILAEYIWGKYAGQTFTTDNAVGSFEAGFTPGVSDGDNGGGSIDPTPTTQYTITWNVKGVTTPIQVNENAYPQLPTKPADCSESRVFVGWTANSSYANETKAPSDLFAESAPKATEDITYYAVYADKSGSKDGGTINDTINNATTSAKLGETSTGNWVADFTITGKTGAVYTIHSMGTKGGTHALQWNSNGYLYCSALPTNGGKLISVTVKAVAAKNVNIFGNTTAYSAKATATNCSTLSATTAGGTYAFTTDYYAIGINGAASSTQITEIVISYEGPSTTYSNYSLSCSGSGSGSTGGSGLIDLGVDPDYYTPIEGLSDSLLKSTLGALTYAKFTTRYSYGSGNHNTWHAFWTTDRDESDNSVVDMYSNNKRYFNPSDITASVADCDIEHMFPNSWWGAKAGNRDAYEDLHHLVPADYSANRSKSNHGPGVPTDTTFNNGVWVNGKDATRDNIVVFCPPDEYKGDFARAFFYIATTYGDTAVWKKEGLTAGHMTNDDWHEFQPAMRELLLTWHRNDPVSDKERERMHKVYLIQGNRNPFIDYPCLAEYIWGDKQGQTVVLSTLASAYDDNFMEEGCITTTDPTIVLPTNAANIGMTTSGSTISKVITVKGINLTDGNLTLSLSGANASLFSLSETSISKANAASGHTVTVNYKPTAYGNHKALLTISGCGVSPYDVPLSGTCAPKYTATWMVEGEQLTTTTAFAGLMPSLPSQPDDCDASRVFVGWTAESSVSDRPSDLFIDEAPMLNSNTTFNAVYADEDKHLETSGSQTYTFSTNKWAASPADWISGKNGYSYATGKGLQVSLSTTGANAACPKEYTNVTTITINYCTNASYGAGSITMYVGENSITKDVTKTGGTTLRNLDFDFSATRPSGEVAISVECTENSVFINSIKISYGAAPTYTGYSFSCKNCTPVEPNASFASSTKSTTCDGSVSNALNKGGSEGAVTYTSSKTDVATVNATTGAVTIKKVGTTTITANIAEAGCYTATSTSYTLTVNAKASTTTFTNPTTSLEEADAALNGATTTSDGTIVYASNNTAVATVNASTGVVTAVKPGTARITASVAATDCYAESSAYYDLTVTAVPTYTVTWKANGVTVQTDNVKRGAGYSLPDDPENCSEDRVFKGWTVEKNYEDASSAPEDLFNKALLAPILTQDTTIYAVYADKKTVSGQVTVTDSLSRSFTGITGTTYADWTDKVGKSGAVYAGNSAGGNSAIQLRTDNDKAGIITTTSPGTIKNVTLVWNSNTNTSRVVNVYGKDTPYSSAANLYSTETQGTLLGSMKKESNTKTSLDISGSYAYVGIRSNSAALYLDSVLVTWNKAGGETQTTYINYSTRCPEVYDFKALAATEVTHNSFMANWTESGGDYYTLDVTRDVKKEQAGTTVFDKNFTESLEGWTINNVSGYENVWTHSTSYGAYATSYKDKVRNAAESWLLSPNIDLKDVTAPSLTLNHVFRYGTTVSLNIKEESAVEWNELSPTNWSAASSWDFINSVADLSSYAGKTIQIGFKYIGTTEENKCPTWEIKRITITGTAEVDDLESIDGYPQVIYNTSALVSGLDSKTTYYYTVTSEDGTISNRIEVTTLESSEPTDMENVLHAPEVRKLLINGQLFILRDGKIYTIQGARVQ